MFRGLRERSPGPVGGASSGASSRCLAIGRWLMNRPTLLLAGRAVAGLVTDPGERGSSNHQSRVNEEAGHVDPSGRANAKVAALENRPLWLNVREKSPVVDERYPSTDLLHPRNPGVLSCAKVGRRPPGDFAGREEKTWGR